MCTHVLFCFVVQNLGRPYWLTLSPMYLWMLVFFTRPHKEERFLFPIYPLICLSGAVALSSLQVCSGFHSKMAVSVILASPFRSWTCLKNEFLQINLIFCRNATTSCSSDTDWSTTQSPPTGWLLAQSWSSQWCRFLALSPSSEVCETTDTLP